MDPEVTSDQGDSQSGFDGLDFSSFSEGEQQPAANAGQGEGDNPKWAPFLETIPEAFHNTFKQQLKAWDASVTERFQEKAREWEPWKQFRDNNVDPNYLIQAQHLADALRSDPVGIYANLHARLTSDPNFRQVLQQRGLIPVEQQPDPEISQDPFTEDDPTAAQLAQLRQQIQERDQQLVQFFQEQERAQQEAAFEAEEVQRIENDFATIEQRTGPLPNSIKQQIVQTAMVQGQQTGRYVSVLDAAPQVFNLLAQAQQARRSAHAPIPTSGGAVPQPTTTNPVEMTKSDRVAYLQNLLNQG